MRKTLDELKAQLVACSVQKEHGCIEWTGCMQHGYGTTRWNGKNWRVPMLVLFLRDGEIKGPCALHHCDNPPCINSDHLFWGTRKDNVDDMIRKERHNYKLPEKVFCTKLNPESVKTIRRLSLEGWSTYKLAKSFSIAQSTIWYLLNGKTWRHVQ